jgi:hypothetical protein
VDAQFGDALSDWRGISCVAESKAGKVRGDSGSRTFILQVRSPLCERLSLAEIEHI